MVKKNAGVVSRPNASRPARKPTHTARKPPWWIAIIGALCIAFMIAAAVAVIVAAGDGEGDAASTTIGPDDPLMEVSTESCEDIAIHIPMAMWNPVLADELLAKGCPWPETAGFTDLEGGVEDPSIPAPYEPEQYQRIFDLFTAQRFGICAVGTFDAPETPGFVYGFRVDLRPMTCAEANPSVTIEIGEFATRALRDQAANDLGPGTLVLGRWAINVSGEDALAAEILAQGVVGLGAFQVT